MAHQHMRLSSLVALIFFSINPVLVHGLLCKFELAQYTYDLCPLFGSDSLGPLATSISRRIRVHQDIPSPPTLIRYTYDIDLGGGGLKRDTTLPPTEQCREGTWICLQISIGPRHAFEPRRILQIIPVVGDFVDTEQTHEYSPRARARPPLDKGVNLTAQLVRSTDDKDALPSLEITLIGGSYPSRPQRAVLHLFCDKSVPEPSTPKPHRFKHGSSPPALSDSNWELPPAPGSSQTDTHGFTWRTRHACPTVQDEPPPSYFQTTEGPSETPQGDNQGDGEEDNIVGAPVSDQATSTGHKLKVGGIVIGSIVALTVLFYGTYILHMQRRKRSYTALSSDLGTPSSSPFSSFPFTLPFALPPLPTTLPHLSVTLPRLPFTLPTFRLPNRNSRARSWFGSSYDPLSAEEYEIFDSGRDQDAAVVDFQRQGLLQGREIGVTDQRGYGTVR